MMKFPIALQLFSVRDEMEQDFEGTLKKVKELGYEGVEFAGLYGNTSGQIKEMLSATGLIPVSAHVPLIDLLSDPENVIETYKEIGCSYIAIPYLTEEYRPGTEGFQKTVDGARLLGHIANEKNLKLLYHNHDFEFVKIGDEYALDVLYQSVPSELLQTELDTCWVHVGGEDPAAYIRKYSGRTPVVHLKDFVMPGKKPAHLYELIGIEKEEANQESDAFELRPLGLGVQDFPEILKASKESGAQWLVIEQDSPSMGKTPMECAEISIKYLRSIL